MIVSHKRKFIFAKLKKTGGTSFEVALSKFADGEKDIITFINHEVEEFKSKNLEKYNLSKNDDFEKKFFILKIIKYFKTNLINCAKLVIKIPSNINNKFTYKNFRHGRV